MADIHPLKAVPVMIAPYDPLKELYHVRAIQLRLPRNAGEAVINLWEEMCKIRLQFRRIRNDRKEIESAYNLRYDTHNPAQELAMLEERMETRTALIADVNFLIIALDKVGSLLRTLAHTIPDNEKIQLIMQRHADALKKWRDFRNHLEHIHREIARGVSDLGSMEGDFFSLDGERLSIGSDLEEQIEQIFEEILSSLEQIITEPKNHAR